jgi:dsDNA-specific endonuclease/ATPase MutS2
MAADEYKDVAKYAKWNEEDQTIEIDWEAINKIKDTEEGDLVKEYIKKLEEFQSKYDEQVQALEEIEDLVQEIKDRGKEEYKSLEDRVRDALIKQIQDKIDEL